MAELPDWQPLGDASTLPNGAGAGRIVGVVASEGAVQGGWAGRAALDLARSCCSAGDKVVLVDGALNDPTLHTHADVENGEGLSDAALFGASVGRVARPVDQGAFFLITAGTAVADANSVAASDRWGRLLEGFLEAGVTLLVFVRDGDSACAAFLGSASQIVVLAGREEAAPTAVRDLEGLVQAVTGPPTEIAAERARVLIGETDPAARAALAKPSSRRVLTGTVLFVVLAVLLVVLLLGVFGIVDVPGITPAPAGTSDALPRPPGSRHLG